MDALSNPFIPSAGAQPPELAGRTELIERARLSLQRAALGRHGKSLIAVGLRGVGKTVLLVRLREIAEQSGYRAVLVEAHEQRPLPAQLIAHLRRVLLEMDRTGGLSEHVKRALRVLASFVSGIKLRFGEAELTIDIEPEHGAADSGDIEADLAELFVAVGRAASSKRMSLALLIDEIQHLPERDLGALIMALHRTTQENLPVVMIGAGLPQVVGLSGRAKSYAERLFDFPVIDALNRADAEQALAGPAAAAGVTWHPSALQRVFEITQGYPYFLQEWGYHTWNEAPDALIREADVPAASGRALHRLDESFFRVRFDRLTPREKDYLRVMAELGSGPHRSGDIADRLGSRVQAVGPLRQGLIRKGMVYSPAHGDIAFTVPLFDQFLKRTMPDWREHPRES